MEITVRKKRKPMSEINVVPYIDVMLVLLIVFMVTAPLLNQGIEIDLPQANNDPLEIDENLETLIVSITEEGEYFLSIGAAGENREPLTLEIVADRVGRIMGANPSIQVLIEGDTNAGWGAMITLITTLQQVGVTNPSFITEPLDSIR
ncbi:MAG: ExbD/TolR family protein [Pseudohongiellaceae bacterium]